MKLNQYSILVIWGGKEGAIQCACGREKFSNIIFQPVQSVLFSPLCNYKAIHVDNDYIGSLHGIETRFHFLAIFTRFHL